MSVDDRQPAPQDPTWPGDLLFSAAVAALAAVLVLRVFPELLSGRLLETDSYMRLVRVRHLAESGWSGWFDGTIPRSNAPFGETLHWTRPVDVLLLVGAWLGAPFLGFPRALHLSGVLLSPVLLLGVCFATAWAVRPLAGGRVRYHAMLTVLAQVGIMGYALPGRADHNMLMLLAFIAMLGSAFRATAPDGGTGHARAAGAWAGLGLWVSTEFLAPLFVLLASFLVLWVWRGEIAARARSMAGGLVLVTLVAVALEHPPSGLLLAEYDRISVVHLMVALLAWAFFAVAASSPVAGSGVRGRTALATVGGGLGVAVMLGVHPDFFGGPMVDVHPELKRSWLPFLTEFQPYLVPDGMAGVGRLVAYLGHALLAVGVVVHRLGRKASDPRRAGAWILLGLALAVFVPLGIRWVRFVTYAEILGVVGTAVLLLRTLRWSERRFSGARLGLVRGAATAGLIAGPPLLGAGIMAVGGETGAAVRQAAATATAACPVDDLLAALNDPGGLGDGPRTVLAHVDLGPTLLYRTPHSVVATPYHRNWQGILDWQRIMATTDPGEARRMVRARGIDVVVACGGAPRDGSGPAGEDPSFAARLRTGRVPDWLAERPTPEAAGVAIYQVRAEGER